MMTLIPLTQESPDYHYKFQTIKSKPHQMFHLGSLDILNKPLLAIVGPRRPSAYAQQVIKLFLEEAQQYDVVTISGLAPGVDQYAHRLSLEYKIPTVAVLGGGIRYYQKRMENALMQKIVDQGGLILSEFEPETVPQTYTFPQRNRIIAGLADLIFLPEAGKKSGSLITVDFGLMMQKPIYGTPQGIFSKESEGLLEYLQEGKIRPVVDFKKLFHQYFGRRKKNISPSTLPAFQNFSLEEKTLLSGIAEAQEAHLDAIAYHFQLPTEQILSQLTMLELKKAVYQASPGVYKVTR